MLAPNPETTMPSLSIASVLSLRDARRALAPGVTAVLAALLVLTGCGESPTAFEASAPAASAATVSPRLFDGSGLLGTGVGAGLLTCTAMPAAHAEQSIGPAGGSIAVGGHVLVVPAGALDSTVLITADAPSDTVNSVKLGPEGLRFAAGHPAALTLSYANCSLLGRLGPKHIAYTNDLLQILQILPSLDNLLTERVTAPVQHFSRYAIAW
jgi:hypothetical protein